MSIDFRENIDPVFAKIFAKIVENFRENCSKIAKQFFENERKFSRNFRENRVSRFSLETLDLSNDISKFKTNFSGHLRQPGGKGLTLFASDVYSAFLKGG